MTNTQTSVGRTNRHASKLLLTSATAITALIMPEIAFAQNTVFDEVVTTARRVTENLQTTPVAVTSLSADTLETRQITDVDAIQYNTPNVTIEPLNGNSGASVSIRGMAGVENTSASDPAVGIYVDGVYSARSSLGLLELVDVERVEVLRGPQGTLFGRNTTGGALVITTPDPEGEWGGRLTGRIGEYDTKEVLGHVNVPLAGEEAGARISFKHAERDGYGESLFNGYELANLNSDYIRGVVKIAPDEEKWDITFTGDYFNRQGNGPIAALVDVNPAGLSGAFLGYSQYISDDFYTNFTATDQFEDITAQGVSATVNYDLGNIQLKSITAWRSVFNNILADIDGTPNPQIAGPAIVLPSPPLPVPGIVIPTGIQYEQTNDQDSQITQELQLFGRTGDLKWIVGGFYFTEHNTDLTQSSTANTIGEIENDSYALYGQADYDFSDALTLNLGLRYTWDKRALNMSLESPGGASCTLTQTDAPGVCLLSRAVKYDYLSYDLGLNYEFTDSIFGYAKTSRATRAGGFNHRVVAPAYEPERVTNYELGLKTQLLDNKVRANLAAFYMDYDNVQRTAVIVVNGAPTATTANAAKAKVTGIEAELDFILNDYFSFGGSLGLLDPSYDEFLDAGNDRSDEPFTYAADYTYNVYATATAPLSFGEFVLHADYGFKGDIFFDTVDLDRDKQEGYGLLNVRAAIKLDNPNIEFAVFGKNVLNEEYNTYILDLNNSLGYTTAFRGTPGVWGAEATVRF
ncbi:TonB-dependent receptor [Litorimonas sp.]|uniref:TonB-dependent receptor n=1 Tax=Litorimonas sp. TaxID=1892381 RepID=UPI003A85BBD1